MVTISDALQAASIRLKDSGISEHKREARLLLSLALVKDKSFIIAYPEYDLKETETKKYSEYVRRRSAHEPYQHIAGKQQFWGLDFVVTPDVMIPRPETEMIVEAAIEILEQTEKPQVCEIGVGSGCISISLLIDKPDAYGRAFDVSEEALRIALLNAEKHGVCDRLSLEKSNLFEVLTSEGFDLIVSNPPYVPADDVPTLQAEVRDFDPIVALTDGKDGLSIIRRIVAESPQHLNAGGFLLMEIGFNQSEKVRVLFEERVWESVELLPDLQGIPRMVKAKIAIDRGSGSI